jgi:serine/threonine-protein kinase
MASIHNTCAPMVVCPACNSRYEEGITFCPRDGTHVVAEEEGSECGKVLADRYRVVRKLGEGGMGEVYEAQHVYIERRFALKLLRREIMTNQEAVTRFHQEARAASAIGHENIVEIDDFGRLPDGRAYLAMEYLEGVSLSDAAKEPLGSVRALEIMGQVCVGLAAAHDKGIIHRDMKPENVFLVRRHGREVAKILDFGIAKVSGADSGNPNLTRTGTIFGTPHYMSPEQALGKSLDKRTDVYSVGVILYEIFTGGVPFRGDSFMAILTQHVTAQPVPPRLAAPDRAIPAGIEAAILRAMAKEPEARFQTMQELAAELARLEHELAGSGRRAALPGPESSRIPVHSTTPGMPMFGGPAPRSPGVPQVAGSADGGTMSASGALAPGTGWPTGGGGRVAAVGGGTAMTVAAAPAAAVAPPSVAALPAPVEPADEIVVRKSRAPLFVVLVLLLSGGGAGGYVLWTRYQQSVAGPGGQGGPGGPGGPGRSVDPPPPPVRQAPPAPEVHPASTPPSEPTPARTISVLIESTPSRAAVIVRGSRVDDTPCMIDVPADEQLAIELHHDGYQDHPAIIDDDIKHRRKLLVKLSRGHAAHHHPAMPPTPTGPKQVPVVSPPVVESPTPPEPRPPVVQPPPPEPPPPQPSRPVVGRPHRPVVVPPPPIGTPSRPPRSKPDPYERLDKNEEPLDPYRQK